MPSLEEAAAFLTSRAIAANVEIKPCKGREAETGREVARLCARLWANEALPPLLSSFSKEALRSARLQEPALPLALLCERLKKGDIEFAQSLGAVAIHLDGNRASLSEARRVKEAGLGLAFYTINESDIARKLWSWGADCLITDKFELIREAVASQSDPR